MTGHGWRGPGLHHRQRPTAPDRGRPGAAVARRAASAGLDAAAPCCSWLALAPAARPGPGRPAAQRRRDRAIPGDRTPTSLHSCRDRCRTTRRAAAALTQGRTDVALDRPAHEDGVLLGRLRTARRRGPELRASWEDVVLAVMAPRAGKTTALAVPAVLDAPGPVVATSNKPDLWARPPALRRAAIDGAARLGVRPAGHHRRRPRTWWWNPLRGVDDDRGRRTASPATSCRRCAASKSHRDFWTSAAHDLLTGLLLAAAPRRTATLVEVYEWLNDPSNAEPGAAPRARRAPAAAASLAGRQNGAPETRDGIYETARTAAQCLRDPRIMAWVTSPTPARRSSSPDDFVAHPRDAVPAVEGRRRRRRTARRRTRPTA